MSRHAPRQTPPADGTPESDAYWRGWNGQSVENYSRSGRDAYDLGLAQGRASDAFVNECIYGHR